MPENGIRAGVNLDAVTDMRSPTTDDITRQLEAAVLAVPGVSELVPTLKDALSQLAQHRSDGPTPAQPRDGNTVAAADPTGDGITLGFDEGVLSSATLDVTVTSGSSVLATALSVQSAAASMLQATSPDPHNREPRRTRHIVKVNVLGIEPGTPAGKPNPTGNERLEADGQASQTTAAVQ